MPHDRRSKNLAWPLEDWNLPHGKWSYYGHLDMKNLDQRLGEKIHCLIVVKWLKILTITMDQFWINVGKKRLSSHFLIVVKWSKSTFFMVEIKFPTRSNSQNFDQDYYQNSNFWWSELKIIHWHGINLVQIDN